MMELRCTLLGDGSSDRALIPVLRWAFAAWHPQAVANIAFADLSFTRKPRRKLSERMSEALRRYPADILFVHRDAELESLTKRKKEVELAIESSCAREVVVCVIPIRMTEAWLLVEERAIRLAADNPRGSKRLDLPPLKRIEDLADPKRVLHELLREASEFGARRLQGFEVGWRVHRAAELIADYSGLEQLSAFQSMREELDAALLQLELLRGKKD